MDEIQTRLQETSKTCLDAYTIWVEKKKDSKAQEDLSSAIHELRKVSSRLEIELAISERDQVTSKPLPIPSHRSNPKRGGNAPQSADLPNMDDLPPDTSGAVIQNKGVQRRRRNTQRKAEEGGNE